MIIYMVVGAAILLFAVAKIVAYAASDTSKCIEASNAKTLEAIAELSEKLDSIKNETQEISSQIYATSREYQEHINSIEGLRP